MPLAQLKDLAILGRDQKKKFSILWDTSGNVASFATYTGGTCDLMREVLKVQTGYQTVEEAMEKFRHELVVAMFWGKTICVNLDVTQPDFINDFINFKAEDETTDIDAKFLFNFEEFYKHENNKVMARVNEIEQMNGSKAPFIMSP